jgi:tape measure domain-containing protein
LARRGVQLFWDSLKQGFENIKGLQSLSLQLKFLVGDIEEVATITDFMKRISNDLGVELLKSSQSFLLFRKSAELAGLSLGDTMAIFESTTKAASVLGKSDAEIRNVQVALEQMLSKGTVQAEELKKQLGNVLPGAFQIMAKAVFELNPEMEKTNKAFIKLLETGKIISADILPEFARQLEKAYGIEAIERIETVAAAQGRVSNAFTSMVSAMEGEESRISKVWISILEGVEAVIDGIENVTLGTAGLQKKFEKQGEAAGNKDARAFGERVRGEIGGENVRDETVLLFAKLELEQRISTAIDNRNKNTVTYDKAANERIRKRISLEIGGYRATITALEEIFGAKKKDEEDDIEIQDRSIEFIKTLITAENKLLLLQTDTGAGIVIKQRIKDLQQEIGLIEEGLRLAQTVIKGNTAQIEGGEFEGMGNLTNAGGDRDEGNLEFLERHIELLDIKNQKTKDTSVNQAISEEIEMYGNLADAIQSGDFSQFAEAGAVANSKFLMSLQAVNPELAREVMLQIELAEAMDKSTEKTNGLSDKQRDMIDIMMLSSEAMNSAADAIISIIERRVSALESEMETMLEKYDLQKELIEAEVGDEESKAERLKQLEKEKELREKILKKKIAKEKEKQFRVDQAAAILTIGIQTAIGIITALAQNPPPSPIGVASAILVGAAGLAQTIAVASQPVPKFKDGHLAGTHSGRAIINDGGRMEVIERKNGQFEMSTEMNKMIHMNKGDKVHKSVGSWFNKSGVSDLEKASMLASANISNNAMSGVSAERQLQASLKGVLSEEIKKGFSKVNINNDNSSVGKAVADALADDRYENNFL